MLSAEIFIAHRLSAALGGRHMLMASIGAESVRWQAFAI